MVQIGKSVIRAYSLLISASHGIVLANEQRIEECGGNPWA
jgi:hypothetical protein